MLWRILQWQREGHDDTSFFFMETSTGEWTADGDNSTMDMFFFLFDDKNCNVEGISTVSNGLIKISIK